MLESEKPKSALDFKQAKIWLTMHFIAWQLLEVQAGPEHK